MASYRLNANIIKGSQGASVVLKAAYRAAERLTNERTGEVYDYSRKGGVVHKELMLPAAAAQVPTERARFWSAVEQFEFAKRKDAQLAREVVVSLPHELTDQQRRELVRGFVKQEFVAQGMAADLAIHAPQLDKGDDARNYHAHILLTLRGVGKNGFYQTKTREWNSDETLKGWRAAWAERQNQMLARHGHADRVDHRSLEAQREDALAQGRKEQAALLDRLPEIHVGAEARQIARSGRSARSDDKWVPTYGKSRQKAPERAIRYSQLDRGLRATYNHQRISDHYEKTRLVRDRLMARDARLRSRQQYYRQQQQKVADVLKTLNPDHIWLQRLLKRQRLLDQRHAMLELLIDRLAQNLLQIAPLEQKALSRQQKYQLQFLLQQRRQVKQIERVLKPAPQLKRQLKP